MSKLARILFIGCFIITISIPSVGMLIVHDDESIENTTLVQWPSLYVDGALNDSYLQDVNTYFENRFAFRSELISTYSMLKINLFNTGTQQVILGDEGWLYYIDTLADYQQSNILSQREISNISHNVSLMQQFVESQGMQFVFSIAPNKNTIYPETMPYYHEQGDGVSNYHALENQLQADGVQFVSFYEALTSANEQTYFKTDTHWNAIGGKIGYSEIMSFLQLPYETYNNVPYSDEIHYEGDLDAFLYPSFQMSEVDYSYEDTFTYEDIIEVEDYMEDFIETKNEQGEGNLFMFRDSFGTWLVPYFSQEMEHAYYSRYTPYYLDSLSSYGSEYVVIEIVERNISNLLGQAPIMQPNAIEEIQYSVMQSETNITFNKDGSYHVVSGSVDEVLQGGYAELFVAVFDVETGKETFYPTFFTKRENVEGFEVYLREESLSKGDIVKVIVSDESANYSVLQKIYE